MFIIIWGCKLTCVSSSFKYTRLVFGIDLYSSERRYIFDRAFDGTTYDVLKLEL